NIKLTGERRYGLRTLFHFLCEMCGQVDKIWSELDNKITNSLNINKAAVVRSHAAGFGHAQMEQMLAAINISCMSSKTYMKTCECDIFDRWLQCADSVIKAAGEEERRIALETGNCRNNRIRNYTKSVLRSLQTSRKYGAITQKTPVSQELGEKPKLPEYGSIYILLEGFEKSMEQHGIIYNEMISDRDGSMPPKKFEENSNDT
ncbi:hypothetical protein PV325_000393, partial [Microctonus aethiopoides]